MNEPYLDILSMQMSQPDEPDDATIVSDEDFCKICLSPEVWEGNDIVLCDGEGCDVAVKRIC